MVLSQAVGLAFLGFVPGLALSLALYWLTSYLANIPIEMNGLGRVALGPGDDRGDVRYSAGLGALRKVWLADPAALFWRVPQNEPQYPVLCATACTQTVRRPAGIAALIAYEQMALAHFAGRFENVNDISIPIEPDTPGQRT